MIKIVRAFNTPASDDICGESKLFVEIEIEGYKKCLGGLPIEWGGKEITNYIKREYPRILREVQLDAQENSQPELRQDLIGKELKLR